MKKYLVLGFLLCVLVVAPAFVQAQTVTAEQIIQALLSNPTLLQQIRTFLFSRRTTPTTVSTVLTAEKILNSNGFVDGKKGSSGMGEEYLSKAVVFGHLDRDGVAEAIAVHSSCGASCGQGVAAFKLVNGKVLMVDLPDSLVAGAAQRIDSMVIADDTTIVIVETDHVVGTRTNMYKVGLVNGVLKAEKTGTVSSSPTIQSISPSSGAVGATIKMTGINLAGFEGDYGFRLRNSQGVEVPLYGKMGGEPSAVDLTIPSRACKQDNTYSGLACTEWLEITPGNYWLYANPWGVKSNEVQFQVVTALTANWKTYRNDVYGFEVKYPSDWTFVDRGSTYGSNQYLALNISSPSRKDLPGYLGVPAEYRILISLTDGKMTPIADFGSPQLVQQSWWNMSVNDDVKKATNEYKIGEQIIGSFKLTR